MRTASLVLGICLAVATPLHVVMPSAAAKSAPAQVNTVTTASMTEPDSGGGLYGWRCRNKGTLGNTLEQIDWLARTTDNVGCETDFRRSADGGWFVYHDSHLGQVRSDTLPDRLGYAAPRNIVFAALTTSEAKKLRYKSGRRVVTAAQFMRRIKLRRMTMMAEVKWDDGLISQDQLNRIVGIADRIGVDIRWETQAGNQGGYVIRGLRDAGARFVGAKSSPSDPERLQELGATFLSTKHWRITPALVAEYRAHGIALRSQMAGPAKYGRLVLSLNDVRVITNKPIAADRWATRWRRRN